MKYRTILLLGAPGSGKGTHGKVLGAILHFFHCACGEVFRNLDPDTPLGRAFREYADRGQLVPDDLTLELWRDFLHANTRSGRFNPSQDTLILDGIPRTVRQAEMLQPALDVRAVINLSCPREDVLIERLQRRARKENRADDADLGVIRTRLQTYEASTRPLLDFYGSGLVRPIDASQPPARVLYEILGVLLRGETAATAAESA